MYWSHWSGETLAWTSVCRCMQSSTDFSHWEYQRSMCIWWSLSGFFASLFRSVSLVGLVSGPMLHMKRQWREHYLSASRREQGTYGVHSYSLQSMRRPWRWWVFFYIFCMSTINMIAMVIWDVTLRRQLYNRKCLIDLERS